VELYLYSPLRRHGLFRTTILIFLPGLPIYSYVPLVLCPFFFTPCRVVLARSSPVRLQILINPITNTGQQTICGKCIQLLTGVYIRCTTTQSSANSGSSGMNNPVRQIFCSISGCNSCGQRLCALKRKSKVYGVWLSSSLICYLGNPA
jgi:hypothetical protein